MTRILIVEDEKTIAELERDYLEIEGFTVEIASTGLMGLDMVNKNEYNLIILDLMLPGMNGFDLCKKIRENHNIPLLMVSSKKEDIDKIRGLGLGADDYITKPFSPSELVARVKAHLAIYKRLVGQPKEQELLIRNLKIIPKSRRVYLDDGEVSLTTTEYDLLYYLATNPDQVFTKDQLLDKIWGMDYFGDGATVTVHIGKLREKIDKHVTSPFIETVWGVGYRFQI
ncbi:response regulator transcription factor [Acidaminobacter sp. JC074]|uniref:response regulator transcription factor n=1 Tax=Acidaminobacter sp. JC074 TaxID=2530199 RepID=UPI001F10C51B|nr:response regulator transcription factor [Acidaminobacter sp. JC074]MCH4889252.1 response regulator transcription factor [Acidaminobacter sp. JC074]